ncbi:hypothetical protein WJ58_13405 [Burkholderia ubonensis]|uniref:FimD/PapC C-terminal domain-containing protein n=1 Tax=Burkholderia ubonensis TaxID=101571 RepID=UPI00075D8C46|nr:hypothetical protein [Burkholderia ubonensis]KVM56515.1 hypothetical protein WJ58_13405 [Burkholderia ubonensis]
MDAGLGETFAVVEVPTVRDVTFGGSGGRHPDLYSPVQLSLDETGKVLRMVGNPSRLRVFGIEDKGSIDVRWGDSQCAIGFALTPRNMEPACERQASSGVRASAAASVK